MHTDVLRISECLLPETAPGRSQSLTHHIPSDLAAEPSADQTATVASSTISALEVSGAVVNPSKPVRLDLQQQPMPAPHLSGCVKTKFLRPPSREAKARFQVTQISLTEALKAGCPF